MRENKALLAFLAKVYENVAHWVFVMHDDPERALGGIRLTENSLVIEFGSDGDFHLVPFVCEKEYRKVALRLHADAFGDFSFVYFALPEMDETCTHERWPELHLPVVRFINVERRKAREETAEEQSRQLQERLAQDLQARQPHLGLMERRLILVRQAQEERLELIKVALAGKGIQLEVLKGQTRLLFPADGSTLVINGDVVQYAKLGESFIPYTSL